MTSNTVLIDYGSGNLHSAAKALARAAGDAPITVTDKPDLVAAADRIVLPGVGAFAACMDQLAARPGLIVEHLGELRRALEEGGLDFGAAVDRRSSPQKTAAPGLPIPTVGGLIFNRAGEVLMVKTHKWSDKWGIPGGKIQWGETSPAALRREIREETGLKVADIQFVLAQDCIRSKEFYRDAHFILLNYTCRVVGRSEVTLNHEAQAFRWVTLAAAKKLKLNRPTRTLLAAVLKKNTGGRQASPSRKRHV